MLQEGPFFLVRLHQVKASIRRGDGHRNGGQNAAAAEIENLPRWLQDLRGRQRLRDVFLEIRARLRPDQVHRGVPTKKLALVDVEPLVIHDAAARRLPRRKCIRKSEIAAGVTPEIRLACPSEIGRTKLSFSTISREKPGSLNDISVGMRSSSSSTMRAASRSCRSM